VLIPFQCKSDILNNIPVFRGNELRYDL